MFVARLCKRQRKALKSKNVRAEITNSLELMAHNADHILCEDQLSSRVMYSAYEFMSIESAAFAECMLSWLYRQNFGKTIAIDPNANARLFSRANNHLLNCMHTVQYGMFADFREKLNANREMKTIRRVIELLQFRIR